MRSKQIFRVTTGGHFRGAISRSYPQPSSQEDGLGFPIARLVALICLSSGAILDAAMGSYAGKETGAHVLFCQLTGNFISGDIVLADRYYASYWLFAMLASLGVDVVLGQHGAPKTDFRIGKRLGTRDHIVTWKSPCNVQVGWILHSINRFQKYYIFEKSKRKARL